MYRLLSSTPRICTHPVGRYGVAVALVAALTLVRWVFGAALAHSSPYIVFYLGVLAAAVWCGMGPALVATALSAVVGNVLFASAGWFSYEPVELVRLGLMLVTGVGISVIGGRLQEVASIPEENPNPVLGVTGRGTITYANAAAREMLGTLGGGALPEALRDAAARVLAEGRGRELELVGGSGRVYVLALAPSARRGRVNVFGRDVTDRRRAQEELRRSEAALRGILDAATESIWLFDREGRILLGNATALARFGRSAGELLGHSFREWLSPELAAARWARMREVLETGRPVQFEDERAGIAFHHVFCPVLDGQGGVGGIACFSRDITEWKRAEELLRQRLEELGRERSLLAAITQATDVMLVYLDREFNFVSVNEAYARTCGKRPEELIGQNHFALYPHAENEAIFRRVRDTGAGVFYKDKPFEFPDQPERGITYWDWSLSPVREGAGPVTGLVFSLRETTKYRQAEPALAEAKRSAEAANRAKDQFLAALSHELRTPLSPALMLVAAQEKNPGLPEAVRRDLATVRDHLELEVRIIDDLLDLSRVISGKMRMELQHVAVQKVLGRAVETCGPDLTARHLRLSLEMEEGPDVVRADPARLQQVFWNLIKNAVKFTPAGGNLWVACRRTPAGTVQVAVRDTGVGIAPEALGRIFDAFEQADASITRQFGGLGLGLAISKAIVDQHGGRISAESPGPGRGATFTVELPLAAAGAAPEANGETTERGPSGAGRKLRLLLVEDHAATAHTLARLLRAAGHEVQTADSVSTALAHLARERFDLLLSDVGLPDGTGYRLMEQAHVRYGLTGVCMSGFGTEADIARGRQAGFAAHLTKPIRLEQLEQTIRDLAGRGDRGGEEV